MAAVELTQRQAELRESFERMITAYGNKDFEAFGTYLRDDTLFEWPYRPLKDFPAEMVGGQNFIEMSKTGMAESEPYGHKVDRFHDMADPDMLIVEYHSDTVLNTNGKRYANQYLGILRYEGDKVIFWKEYLNPLAVLEVYGADYVNTAVSAEA